MAFPKSFISNTANETAELHRLKFTGVHINKSIEFLAFVESFSQNFTSTWNSENVYGRNDPIGTFQGTQRKISISWTIPSGNEKEAMNNLERASSLTQLVYPTYSKGGPPVSTESETVQSSDKVLYTSNALTLSKAPLIRLKYANLINDASGIHEGLLGWIDGISWTPVIEMGFFEGFEGLYPKAITMSVEFSVIHEHDLGWLPDGSTGGFDDIPGFPFDGPEGDLSDGFE
jgi:hypothetical protein